MATEVEYALMAGRSYQSSRATINWLPDLSAQGWTEGRYERNDSSGFEAVSFQKGNEIVISCAGTGSNVDWWANAGGFFGVTTDQLREAADYYLQVKAANPGATISLTGHSLGGGLASLMAVFFDETAVTFDQAPFRNSASVSVATSLKEYLLNERGYSQTDLQGLTNFISAAAGGGVLNNNNVVDFSVQGEILSTASGLRIGTSTSWTHGAPDLAGISLHSHALLTAFLQSDRTAPGQQSLSDVTFKLPDGVRMIFDSNLYAFPTALSSNRENFIERLVRHENGITGNPITGEVPVQADAMLTRFTRDLWKLAQDGGLTMADDSFAAVKLVSQTLIAFAMQKYYTETQASAGYNQELFKAVTGGVRFDLADVTSDPLNTTKGYSLYFHDYVANSFSPGDRDRIYALLPGLRDWYVQAGRGGMEATDTQNRGAFMLGGTGTDSLTGGAGDDLLVGNGGHDRLTGGAGTDTLIGGTGFDRYYYSTGDGSDRIEDSDARGMINVNGQVLVGGIKKADHTYWESADGSIRYEMSGTDLVVKLNGQQILTVNEDFRTGQFGIRLVDLPTVGEVTRTEFLKIDHYSQAGNLPDGTPIYEPVYAAFFDDNGNDTRSTAPIGGLTPPIGDDNNLIHAGGGDDFVQSGAGDDQLYGEGNADWIFGGLGNDQIFGGTGDDRLMGDNVAVSTSGGDDYLDGGEGDDFLQGGAGRDIVLGGAGNDLLNGDEFAGDNSGGFDDWLDGGAGNDDLQGGAGSDVLIGGADHDFLLGDRTQYQDGTPAQGGHDVLDGGSGNDVLYGVYGDDVLSGGEGKDLLNGQDGNDVLDGGGGDDWLSGDLRLITSGAWGQLGNRYVFDTNEYRAAGGDDVLFGESGNDLLIGGEGSDTLNGGDENDVLFGGYDTGVVSTSDPLYWTFFTAPGTDWLDAGAGADIVHGGIGADTLLGGEGDDQLFGSGGDDVLEGGAGDDQLYGDYLDGEFGAIHPFYADIMAFAGHNTLSGGGGDDALFGGDLADTLLGGDGNDRLTGGGGADILLGEGGDDRILDDNPYMVSVGDNETIDGGDGHDYLESWWGDDLLLGGAGNDVLISRAGTDSLIGGEGHDYLVWDNTTGATTQALYGGPGNDVYHISTDGAVVMEIVGEGIDLVIGGGSDAAYVLPDTVENYAGAVGIGNRLDNVMSGGNLEGREGNDTLIGTGRLDGGVGDDFLQSGYVSGLGYFEGSVYVQPSDQSALLQPLPHPKPTEPYWYLQEWYPDTAFRPGNTYVFGSGYGHDTIQEMDNTFNSFSYQNEDTVEFLSGVMPSDVIWVRRGNDLELSMNGGEDQLTVESFFDLTFYRGGYSTTGLWVPPEGYEVQIDYSPSAGFPTYIAYARVEYFTFADGTVWTPDHFGAPLLGDWHADTYEFGRGAGQVKILDFDLWPMNTPDSQIDAIRMGSGVLPDDLEVVQNGNDLILAIKGTDDYATLQSFFSPVKIAPPFGHSYDALPYRIERLQFDDGTLWSVGDLYSRLSVSQRFSTIVGTTAADSLSGDSGDNVIQGLEGDDALYGGGGHDALYGGPGNDYLQGHGNDGGGGDYFEGGPGNDSILGAGGGNTYVFRRGDGQDTIGNDDPYHGPADTLVFADFLPADITVQQRPSFSGFGTSSLELVVHDSGDRVILGNWIELGDSELPYQPAQEMEFIQFADGTVWTTADLIAHAQGMTRVGSDGDESLSGSVFNDVLRGEGGDDSLSGGKGNDLLDGGSGIDYLEGGFGDDTYIFGVGSGNDQIMEDLYWYPHWGVPKPNDVDVIQLGAEVTPDSVALQIDLSNNLVVKLVGTTDELTILNFWRDEKREIERMVFADGTVWDSTMIVARTPGLTIIGSEFDDYLPGTVLNDTILGSAGDDWLFGWSGADQLAGGSGDDTYEFNLGDGLDTIRDTPLPGQGNSIWFGDGISRNDLTFIQNQVAHTLTIQVGSSGTDKLILPDFDPTGASGSLVITTIEFADGGTVALTDLLAPVANNAPTVANQLADQSASEDAPWAFVVPGNTFADTDVGEVLTYGATLADGSVLPAWLSFNATTHTFTGTPDDAQVGRFDLNVTVTDSGNLSVSDVFTLTVQNVNEAPTVATPLLNQTVLEDVPFSLAVPANMFADQDTIHGDALTYSAMLVSGTPLPAWLTFDPLARTFTGTPLNSNVGTHNLRVTATDVGGLSVSSSFALTVQNVNDAPVVAVLLSDQTGAEDEPFLFTVPAGTFADEDGIHGDTLFYRARLSDGQALPAWLSFNPVTRTFTGTPGAGTAGYLQLAVTATDTGGLTAAGMFALAIGGPLPKTFIGTEGNDVLMGARGNDTLMGLGGQDTLYGKEGNDWLDGGSGSDTLVGGIGDDTYVVNATGDVVTELAGEGLDTVRTSLSSYTLGANLENLTLTGGISSLGVGNALNNTLVGDAGPNLLSGGAGNDVLQGGMGIDALVGGTGNDLYQYARGDGRDVIRDKDTMAGNQDQLAFGTTINPLDLILERQANDLRLRVYGSQDQVLIDSWYSAGTVNQLETIQAGNGQTLLNSQVDQLIQAMASFSQQSGLTWDQAIDQRPQDVQAVLAGSWQ